MLWLNYTQTDDGLGSRKKTAVDLERPSCMLESRLLDNPWSSQSTVLYCSVYTSAAYATDALRCSSAGWLEPLAGMIAVQYIKNWQINEHSQIYKQTK